MTILLGYCGFISNELVLTESYRVLCWVPCPCFSLLCRMWPPWRQGSLYH